MSEPIAAERVVVDRELCIGSGMCIVYAPGTFAHDAQAKAVVQHSDADAPESVAAALDACPTGALSLRTSEREA